MLKKEMKSYSTKSSLVLDILRENIINGHLKPGQKLVLKHIAEELDVSVLPVREAIRHLQAEGLVTKDPHMGSKVSQIPVDELIEILEIRGILEAYAARISVQSFSKSEIRKLENLLNEMKKLAINEDRKNYGFKNREFHEVILSQCPLNKITEMINDIRDKWNRSRSVFEIDPERMHQSYLEHVQILESIKAKDSEKVEELMRIHSIHMLNSIKKLLELE
ncbi:MAG: GntR family transcriptional regulator [Acholeplasmataceae bacterium]